MAVAVEVNRLLMIWSLDPEACWYKSETRTPIEIPSHHRLLELESNTAPSTTKSVSVLKLHSLLWIVVAGELKKMLTGPTGLHHQDQKLLYKDKERDSKAFLDMAGVKDKSKIVLVEDPISQEKRLLETRKNAKIEKASKSISQVSLEVDRLAGQVSAFETIITKGGKVAEKDLINSIELLMSQLLKLDAITADGDVKLQRKMQVRRVQKYVETLDMLKIKNAMPSNNGGQMEIQNQHKHTNGQKLAPTQEQKPRHFNWQRLAPVQEQQSSNSIAHLPIHQHHQSASGPVVVTTNWETFDSSPASLPVPSASTSTANNSVPPKFPWDFFD
ncbi:hypothetical protein ES319_D08G119300v1 [Gossypium barbadense]|uniref:BAG domain-containing protein n=1 Tax=Gossypium barbadense TaxID=3634 RepID=A0A5J5QCL8_GOSBA|nr:hypothetical protein ES319_D08G119300v1 [Gossypium barbadense]